jgi:hypothetical protein
VNGESPAQGRALADALNVGNEFSERDRRDAWAKVPRFVAAMDLTTPALRLLIVLSSYADGRTRLAWPSQAELGWITRSTGQPDRRRVSNALATLIEADLVREAGRQRHGERAWTNRYLVAPFPVEDVGDRYASSNEAAPEDAYKPGPRMRMNRVEDAAPSYARTDPLTRPTESEKDASATKNHEDQDPEPDPKPLGSIADWFRFPRELSARTGRKGRTN